MAGHSTNGEIARIAALLRGAQAAVAFTGAGISTESGIPDFRSPGGTWSRYAPVMYQDFLKSAEARREYWRRRREGYPGVRAARPNAGHLALAELEAQGRLRAVITQNIDGLHQEAGSRRVLELHGTSRRVGCLSCGREYDPDEIQRRLENGTEAPECDTCGGFLKPSTVSFGQPMPREVLAEALSLCMETDLVLVLGSSLVVEPAASLPLEARRRGAGLVIVNRTETPLDAMADVVVREGIGEVLAAVVAGVKNYEL